MNWYITVLKKYAVFSGRAQRKELWLFTLFSIIIASTLGIVEGLAVGGAFSFMSNIYSLAVLIPTLAVCVRRMHDTNRSGWWLLLPIVNFVFAVLDSQPETNRFGPNPKADEA